MSKQCTKCGLIKNLDEYPIFRGKYKSYCKLCSNLMCRDYKARNRSHVAEYNRVYKSENRESISVYNHNYNLANREAIRVRQNSTRAIRRQTDENFYIATMLRSNLNKFIKTNGRSCAQFVQVIINCSWDNFCLWLTYLFDSYMSMENYGSYWTIDHVDPCCAFDLTKTSDMVKCFHWSNLRPLKKLDNQKKTGKQLVDIIANHRNLIEAYLRSLPAN